MRPGPEAEPDLETGPDLRPGVDHPLRVITGTGPPDDTAMWAPKPVTDKPEQDGPALHRQL